MDKEALIGELKNIIGDFLQAQNLELVDLIYRFEGRDLFLRILADRPEGGITIGECTNLNRDVGTLLDEKDIIPDRYILEVSSPGLDRPLQTKKDFQRNMNKKVRVFLNELVEAKLEHAGIIVNIGEDIVSIRDNNKIIEIPLVKITKAKLII